MKFKNIPVAPVSVQVYSSSFTVSPDVISALFVEVRSWLLCDWNGNVTETIKKAKVTAATIPVLMDPVDKGGYSLFGLDRNGKVIIGCAYYKVDGLISVMPTQSTNSYDPSPSQMLETLEKFSKRNYVNQSAFTEDATRLKIMIEVEKAKRRPLRRQA